MLKRKSIVKEWGISYALILLIPLITIFVNYYYNTKIIKKEIMQAHELILDNLKENVDLLMEEEWQLFTYFYMDESFKNLVCSQDLDTEFYYDVYRFTKQLSSHGTSNGNVSYWLYMKEKDFIISDERGSESYGKYNAQKLLSDNILSYEEWKQFLTREYANEFFIYDGLYGKTGEKSLVYANSYSYADQGNANIFITVPVSVIGELTHSLPPGSSFVIDIVNEREELTAQRLVVNSDGLTEPSKEQDIYWTKGAGVFETKDYMGISVMSDNSKVAYSLLVPQEVFWKESRYIRNVHLVSLLITVFVGIGLMIYLLRRNFQPVSSLLTLIGGNNKERNEFEQIEVAYGMVQQENRAMRKTIQSHEKNIVSSFLLSLLKGRVAKISDREQEVGLNLSTHKGTFSLVGFYIPPKRDELEYDELSFFVVDNIFSELMEKEDVFYCIEEGRFLFYLFCITEGHTEQWKEESLQRTGFLCDFLEEKFGLNILAAISEVESDISRAHFMYQSIIEAFEYKRIIGSRGVVTTKELQVHDEESQFHVFYVMLARALENGKLEDAQKVSEQFFLSVEHMPFNALRLRILEVFQVINDCYNTYITDSVKRMQLLTFLEGLLKADNIADMKTQYDSLISFAYMKIQGQWESGNIDGIVARVKDIVEANYMDSNLNIGIIAEKINRNSKYISKVFKDETGESILDYINVLRIRKAQQILLVKRVPVEELSEMVGYASARTFRRSFMKITGMTPGAYLSKK